MLIPVFLQREKMHPQSASRDKTDQVAIQYHPTVDDDGYARLSLKGLVDVIEYVNGMLTASLAVVCAHRSHE